jgi:hypothetical protein
MSIVAPELIDESGPCLTTAPWGGRVISLLFAATVLLFLLWLFAL